ncbi:50S ribosomal protein L25 [Patescibacteria group bacterium]|nr:50S ribosomal protein L25 [Patescibacteria group bacterium]MBU1015799.1 50S ribosomal protein L25 [Patescibacteria group bacterium]MBU1685555.1 50S ribosomal protein L25 [Patescibacteria group bacterium]MBU1938954.1 50S ribosomal protein L25 [Patescibacteria group bacterium]
MEPIIIEVTKGKYATSKEARKNGRIPIVYYSKDVQPTNFSVDYQDFRRAYKKAGRSAIITLIDENKDEYQALTHELQYHPVTDAIIHVDMMAIKKGQKIETEVPIVLVGEAPAIRELGGILVRNKDRLWIKCLPNDLPHEIPLDVSGLVDFHSSLTVGDIKVPEGITIMDAEDISVVTISAPRREEEPVIPAAAAAEAVTEEAAEGEEKKEEGAGASE